MFYVYAHYTSEDRLFYIGKGSKNRAHVFYNRGTHWNNVVAKHGSPIVKILAEFGIEQDAFAKEIELIKHYREQGFKLCNVTDGGEGTSGYKATAEQIERNRLVHIGQPAWNKGTKSTEKHIENNRLGHIGQVAWNKGLTVGPIHSEEFKAKISALHKGNKWRQGLPSSAKQKATASALSKGNIYATGNTARRTWVWVGTNTITGEVVKYIGEKEMLKAGLQHSNIIKCINGERKSHKGYIWTREPWSNI
jgi:hypothetical protein